MLCFCIVCLRRTGPATYFVVLISVLFSYSHRNGQRSDTHAHTCVKAPFVFHNTNPHQNITSKQQRKQYHPDTKQWPPETPPHWIYRHRQILHTLRSTKFALHRDAAASHAQSKCLAHRRLQSPNRPANPTSQYHLPKDVAHGAKHPWPTRRRCTPLAVSLCSRGFSYMLSWYHTISRCYHAVITCYHAVITLLSHVITSLW